MHYHPKKNHASLIKNINKVIESKKHKIHVLLIGKNINKKNNNLLNMIGDHHKNYTLMGEVSDINNLMLNCDIYIQSSSFGESFPNALVEAILGGNKKVLQHKLGSTNEII